MKTEDTLGSVGYKLFINAEPAIKKSKNYWVSSIRCIRDFNNYDEEKYKVYSIMLAATLPYLGEDVNHEIRIDIKENDAAVSIVGKDVIFKYE